MFDTLRVFWWRLSITVQVLSFILKAAEVGFPFSSVLCLVFPLIWKSRVCSSDLLESRALEQLTFLQNYYDLRCPGKKQLCNCPVIPCKWKDTITQPAFQGVKIGASCERNQMKRPTLHSPQNWWTLKWLHLLFVDRTLIFCYSTHFSHIHSVQSDVIYFKVRYWDQLTHKWADIDMASSFEENLAWRNSYYPTPENRSAMTSWHP